MMQLDRQLGFDWGSLFSQVAQTGTQVYAARQRAKLEAAQAQQQLALQRAMMPPPAVMPAPQVGPQVGVQQPIYYPTQQRAALPGWLIPAAVIGGGFLLFATLRRK